MKGEKSKHVSLDQKGRIIIHGQVKGLGFRRLCIYGVRERNKIVEFVGNVMKGNK